MSVLCLSFAKNKLPNKRFETFLKEYFIYIFFEAVVKFLLCLWCQIVCNTGEMFYNCFQSILDGKKIGQF